jgi:hypothetical protein
MQIESEVVAQREAVDHTPGEWEVREMPLEDGRYVIDPYIAITTSTTDRDKANARLMAAAPCLLAAIQGLIDTCPACSDTTERFQAANDVARAAIAKATGIW